MPEAQSLPAGARKLVQAHGWELERDEHYVENRWVAKRIFEAEEFTGNICDPCCGFGRIPEAAVALGFEVFAFDLVDRGWPGTRTGNFLESAKEFDNFVFNPPFKFGREFALHAIHLARHKVAMIYPTRRLNAAGGWLKGTPLRRVSYLTPRPSMPPGVKAKEYELRGKEPSGGKQDFCVLFFDKQYGGFPLIDWLHRDGGDQ